jgi:hypothetical protein
MATATKRSHKYDFGIPTSCVSHRFALLSAPGRAGLSSPPCRTAPPYLDISASSH